MGVYDLKTGTMILRGDPEIQGEFGDYTADEVRMDFGRGELEMEGDVKLEGNRVVIRGNFLKYMARAENEKMMMREGVILEEFSREDSLLEGQVYRRIWGDEFVYFNVKEDRGRFFG